MMSGLWGNVMHDEAYKRHVRGRVVDYAGIKFNSCVFYVGEHRVNVRRPVRSR